MKTWTFQNGIYVESSGTVAGPKEAAGPLSEPFDQTYLTSPPTKMKVVATVQTVGTFTTRSPSGVCLIKQGALSC